MPAELTTGGSVAGGLGCTAGKLPADERGACMEQHHELRQAPQESRFHLQRVLTVYRDRLSYGGMLVVHCQDVHIAALSTEYSTVKCFHKCPVHVGFLLATPRAAATRCTKVHRMEFQMEMLARTARTSYHVRYRTTAIAYGTGIPYPAFGRPKV